MTTPTPPALSVTADKATYNVGDAIIVTVQTPDGEQLVELTVTANATDEAGNGLTGTTTVQVSQSSPTLLGSAAVTDSFGDSYTAQGATSGVSSVVFAGVVGTPPGRMILVIDATATDSAGNVLAGSVAVTVNTGGAPAQEQVAAPPDQPQGLAPFQQRSLMMARGWSSR